MSLRNTFGLLYEPEAQWKKISEKNDSIAKTYFKFLFVIALIPPVSAYIGATYVGWSMGVGEVQRLTAESALQLSVAAYFAILLAIYFAAQFIRWMAKTYGASPSLKRCMNLAAYSATPLFLVGFSGAYPVLWLDMLLSLVAIGWAVYLLYQGVPIMMRIEKERGFLFASSILTAALCIFVGMIAMTILFWGLGITPKFG